MFYKILIICLTCLLCLSEANIDLPLNDTNEYILSYEQGTVRGRIDIDVDGKSFYSFQGIPYAKPPVGDLRFKEPEPFEKWDKHEIWDGTKEGPKCPQKLLDGTIEGDENCLFVNVYTRYIEKDFKGTKNVLVWFHGGSFVEGSGNTDIHGPKYIVSEDIVLVTFNYRLGALGFLTIDDPQFNISGNAGIKDQLLVLRWVRKYIHNFGGDATRVTIGGNSAGGISADLHMLSTYSNNNEKLFNRVISQSAPLMLFEVTWPKPGWARDLAVLMQFDPTNNSTADLYDHLKNQDVGQLLDAQTILSGVQNTKNFIRPCLEPETAKNRIISDLPINIIKENKFRQVPYLKGFVDQEAMFVLLYIAMNPNLVPKDAKDVEAYLPKDMGLQPGTDKSLEYATKVYKRYFHENENQIQNYLNLVGDTSFVYPINRQALEMAKVMGRNSLFYYLFTLDTELNLFKRQLNITDYKGAAHTDEKGYLFNFDGSPKIIQGSDLYKYIKRMLKLWTNFAKYGDPNGVNATRVDGVYWPSVTKTELNYLKIDKELTRGIAPFSDMIKFWDELYESLRSKGFFPQSNPLFCFITVSVFVVSVFYSA